MLKKYLQIGAKRFEPPSLTLDDYVLSHKKLLSKYRVSTQDLVLLLNKVENHCYRQIDQAKDEIYREMTKEITKI